MRGRLARTIATFGCLVAVTLSGTACSGSPAKPKANGSSQSQAPQSTPAAAARPAPKSWITPRAVAHPERLPTIDHWAVIAGAPRDPAPTTPTTGRTAVLTKDVIAYAKPGGPALGVFPKVTLRDTTRLPILDETTYPNWILVPLPVRRGLPSKLHEGPNGATGWIYLPRSGVVFETNPYEIVVNTALFKMSIRKNGRTVQTWTVSIGTDANPTPTGVRTYISAAYHDDLYAYTRVVVYLSVFSPTLDSFDGGPAPSAIHGWFGETVSQPIKVTDGCVRVPDDALEAVYRLPIGTPVLIRPVARY